MKIGIRTIKTALGAGLSIWIAHMLDLEFYVYAGILTILCIDVTKKRSLTISVSRFLACTLGLFLSGAVFEVFGYQIAVISLFILLFIPLLIFLRIQSGFVTSSVIILHVFVFGDFSLSVALNELLLITIGIGMALVLNSYMPNLEKDLEDKKNNIEEKIKKILYEYALYIERGDQGWTGREILELDTLLNESKSLAIRNVENHLLRKQDTYYAYFEMREKQLEILERMLPIVSKLDQDVPQRQIFASFLYQLSKSVHSGNTAHAQIKILNEKKEEMARLELPKTREEFETRATLLHLINEIYLYLEIKSKMNLESEGE